MAISFSDGIDAYCKDNNITTWEGFVAAIATQQEKADTEHTESRKVDSYEYTGCSLENTGFSQSNTGLEIGATGGEIGVTGLSASGLLAGIDVTLVKLETDNFKFEKSGLFIT
jgi:hypothetical protein